MPVIERLNAALNDPALVPRLVALGYYPAPGTPDAFGALMRSDAERWGAVVKRAGIEAQEAPRETITRTYHLSPKRHCSRSWEPGTLHPGTTTGP